MMMKDFFIAITVGITSFFSQVFGPAVPIQNEPEPLVQEEQQQDDQNETASVSSQVLTISPNLDSKDLPSASIKPPDKISPEKITVKPPDKISPEKVTVGKRTVEIISPKSLQSFSSNEKIKIEAKVSQKPNKVVFYVGSGSILATLTESPYVVEYDLEKSGQGKYKNYRQPLEVRAFYSDGTYEFASALINIVPSELNNPDSNNVPSEQRGISFDNISFVLDFDASQKSAKASGTYEVESYDSFNNMSSIRTKVHTTGLKSNTEYVLFAMTKNGQMEIGNTTTDGGGSGQFFTGLGSDQHYCDIYQLGIREKSTGKTELWTQELSSKCQRG